MTDAKRVPKRPRARWHPIASAPNGTLLLMCSLKATELRNAVYVDWLVDGRLCGDRTRPEPTHWMPLPLFPGEVA